MNVKECIQCSKSISYKNWAVHLRTDKHIDNVERCKILVSRQLEQLEKERKEQERMNVTKEEINKKFTESGLVGSSPAGFNPVFNNKSTIKFNHHESLPNNFRMLILGESNCGKTNLLLKMILTPGIIDFNNLIIFSSTAEQTEYQLLYHGFNNNLTKEDIIDVFRVANNPNHSGVLGDYTIKEICHARRREVGSITCQLSSSENEILHPNDIPTVRDCDGTTVKTLMVFDDLVCVTNQSLMAEYFVLGRHYNINTIYLTQSLIKVPKNGIRDNSNMLILFHLPKTDLRYLYNNLFKYLDENINENTFFNHMEILLSTKYSHATYNKDKRSFIVNIFQASIQTGQSIQTEQSIHNEQSDEE